MVRRDLQDQTIARVEGLFSTYGGDRLDLILGELESLGFVRKGGNVAAMTLEQTALELFLIIGLDEEGRIASFEIKRFEDLEIVRR